jgi:hypothetical protein
MTFPPWLTQVQRWSVWSSRKEGMGGVLAVLPEIKALAKIFTSTFQIIGG